MLIDNVFREIGGNEYRLAVNKHCSQTLEVVLESAAGLHIRTFLHHLQKK